MQKGRERRLKKKVNEQYLTKVEKLNLNNTLNEI